MASKREVFEVGESENGVCVRVGDQALTPYCRSPMEVRWNIEALKRQLDGVQSKMIRLNESRGTRDMVEWGDDV